MALLAVLKVGDNRDVIIISTDTCVTCLERQEQTRVMKTYPVDATELSSFRKYAVPLLRCKCKGVNLH